MSKLPPSPIDTPICLPINETINHPLPNDESLVSIDDEIQIIFKRKKGRKKGCNVDLILGSCGIGGRPELRRRYTTDSKWRLGKEDEVD